MSRIPAQGAVVSVSALAVVASVYLMGGVASGSTIDASTSPLSLTATTASWSGSAFGATAVSGVNNADVLAAASGTTSVITAQSATPTTSANTGISTTTGTSNNTFTADSTAVTASGATQATQAAQASTAKESAASITGNFVAQVPTAPVKPAPVVKAAPKPVAVVKAKVVLTPKSIAQSLAAKRGWTGAEWVCLDKLWQHESKYQITARNSRSGAYGIPQALPASKMATAGADWRTNATTQVTWGLNYIRSRYGNPCGAWSHELRHGSY